jgi:parallel beta-helix repeat protein
VPFATRPASAAVRLSNCSNVIIENRTFRDLGAGVIAIRIENCSNVTIRAVDFLNVAEGVYALNSSNITIVDARYSNITGPAQPRTGANVANFVQFNNVAGGLIDHNKGRGGDTEDIVSIYQSDHVTVEDNHFEGTNWTSGSGSGIALADGGGSYNTAQRNVLVNPGQVGIFIAGGTNNRILDNTIYGEQRPNSNVGLYVWNQSSSTCAGNEVSRNLVWWRNATGASNPSWNAGNCGTVAGWSTNVWNPALNLASLRVLL